MVSKILGAESLTGTLLGHLPFDFIQESGPAESCHSNFARQPAAIQLFRDNLIGGRTHQPGLTKLFADSFIFRFSMGVEDRRIVHV